MDETRQELIDKIAKLVAGHPHNGDYNKAFAYYDTDGDGLLTINNIKTILGDAKIGNMLTRIGWARGVVDALDQNRDGMLSWAEFESVVK